MKSFYLWMQLACGNCRHQRPGLVEASVIASVAKELAAGTGAEAGAADVVRGMRIGCKSHYDVAAVAYSHELE